MISTISLIIIIYLGLCRKILGFLGLVSNAMAPNQAKTKLFSSVSKIVVLGRTETDAWIRWLYGQQVVRPLALLPLHLPESVKQGLNGPTVSM